MHLLASKPVKTTLGVALTCALCVLQKRVVALFAPGVPGVWGTSASAYSAQARPSRQSAAATAPPTTTAANSAPPPACRRGGLMWSSTAAATKVGNWLADCAITLNQLATERLSLVLSSDLWHIFQSSVDSHHGQLSQQQLGSKLTRWKRERKSQCMSITKSCYVDTAQRWVIELRATVLEKRPRALSVYLFI